MFDALFGRIFDGMSDEKIKRMARGLIAGGTVLVLTLLSVLAFQLISMAVTSARKDGLEKDITQIQQTIQDLEGDHKYYSGDYFKALAAGAYGYIENK